MNIDNKISIANIMDVYRRDLMMYPTLRNLFLELTTRCNEHCLHCGSFCGDKYTSELTLFQYQKFLLDIKRDFGVESLMLCITGGEPLLREDFFGIMSYAYDAGFNWGMTSNGTLIDDTIAHDLKQVGMKTISISLDGMPDTHNAFRQSKNGWSRTVQGIESLVRIGGFENIQVTTVVTHKNIHQLDDVYYVLRDLGIHSWRIINIEPVGRALLNSDYLLSSDEYQHLFQYIKNMRQKGRSVSYGCSHFLGIELELELRNWFYLCGAGTMVASVMANGDITACLDIDRRSELIQGNILTDRFKDVWENRFRVFRRNLSDSCEKCQNCNYVRYCSGDSFHSWDFENHQPLVCFKGILF